MKKLPTTNYQLPTARQGFTLVETLVVATIVILVSVGGFLGLAQYRNKQALESGLNEIRAAAEGVKRQSVTQEQGTRWGVRFTNATSGVSSYSIFRGSSYSTSGVDHVYSLRSPVRFGNPSASSTYDVVFAPLSGALSENKVLTVIGGSAGSVGDLILRTVGSITARTDKNVAGYWHFDEGTSTLAYDASGHGNNGTLTNGPTWMSGSSCKAGNCTDFDGTNDFVDVGDPSSGILDFGDDDFTVAVWTRIASAYSTWNGSVVNKWNTGGSSGTNEWNLAFGGSSGSERYPSFAIESGSTTYVTRDTSAQATVGIWYFLVGVRDGSVLSIYVNGALASSTDVGVASVNNVGRSLLIGKIYNNNSGTTTGKFLGRIDEVRVWSRALSASEIEALYDDLK